MALDGGVDTADAPRFSVAISQNLGNSRPPRAFSNRKDSGHSILSLLCFQRCLLDKEDKKEGGGS